MPCVRNSSKCIFLSVLLSHRKSETLANKELFYLLYSLAHEPSVVLQENQLGLLFTLSYGLLMMPFVASEFLRLPSCLSPEQDCVFSRLNCIFPFLALHSRGLILPWHAEPARKHPSNNMTICTIVLLVCLGFLGLQPEKSLETLSLWYSRLIPKVDQVTLSIRVQVYFYNFFFFKD